MTQERIWQACIEVVEELRQAVFIPWRTGYMATHGLRYRIEGDVFHIYMDTTVVPYVPYTNEPWVSKKWHGKQNPNEGWWNVFSEIFANRLAQKLKGEIYDYTVTSRRNGRGGIDVAA